MRIIIEHFGPIERVEFDLTKDINVVFGKNNIGKSYAITAVYLVLKHFGDNRSFLSGFNFGLIPSAKQMWLDQWRTTGLPGDIIEPEAPPSGPYVEMSQQIRATLQETSKMKELDVTAWIEKLLLLGLSADAFAEVGTSFRNSFQSVAQLPNKLSNGQLLVAIVSDEMTLNFRVRNEELVLDEILLRRPVFVKLIKTKRRAAGDEQKTILYFKTGSTTNRGDALLAEDREMARYLLFKLSLSLQEEKNALGQSIYFLPASRSGLYQALSTFGAVVAELSKSRHFVTSNFSLPAISEPMADYFLSLSSLKDSAGNGLVAEIGRQMEQEILGGEVGFDQDTKKLSFTQANLAYAIDLGYTSSMIAEIAPVVAFLKYILKSPAEPRRQYYLVLDETGTAVRREEPLPTALLFIEEPEAHLHPEVQVKLMEFFARLTKHNVRVLMTTHSNYLFNKLSNMVLKGELTEAQVGSHLMRATPTGSVVVPGEMQAINGEGIPDENFVDVAEQLYNERLAAYDAQNAQPAA